MNWSIDIAKKAIRDHSVFNGLAVDDREKFSNLFLHPNFKLAVLDNPAGYVIFEVFKRMFVFHLVNFNEIKARNTVEDVLEQFVLPYCLEHGLNRIQARAERRGMEVKLERMGLVRHGSVYQGEINHVF